MRSLGHLGRTEAPYCPVCEGPCKEDLPRSPYAFPDRLPRVPVGEGSRDPDPVKAVKPNRRGRRMVRGPQEDRMVHGPEDDR